MSRTADARHWDSTSSYHQQRLSDAHEQVKQYIVPVISDLFNRRSNVSIIDFACGTGGIASEVSRQCLGSNINLTRFGLVDVNEDNLPYAKEALIESLPETEILTFRANGSDFSDFKSFKYDFLYCFDAMVHFDILDIAGYLKTLSNICSGYALFHHSNYQGITVDIRNNPHWRNFMSKDIFMQMCLSAGHEVVSQRLMHWGQEDLDCMTLVRV